MSSHRGDSFWDRLKDSLAFRVGTIYAGASWFVVEAADTLGASETVVRAAALALAAGFLIVVPLTWWADRRARGIEKGGLADGHWGIGTRASRHIRSRSGTRRWVATLVILILLAGALWFGGTRVYGGSVPEAATRIAVIPFQGSGSEAAREFGIGIVDLLSASLDHVGDIRVVSARTVLARTGTEPGVAPSLDDALDIGVDLRAGSIVTGSVTSTGQTVRLTAEIRAIADATLLATASVDGPEADILVLTDELAVALVREMWRSNDPLPTVSTAGLLTSSPAALREYLRGERLLRGLQFESATAAFRAATTADSAFALAWARLAESAGWGQEVETVFDRRVYADNAARHSARLPVRERSLIRALQSKLLGSFDAADSLAAYVRRYPDDPYGWYLLGDTRFHITELGLYSETEVIDPFLEAVRLDPSFALGLTHLIDHTIATGDREQFDALLADYARVVPAAEIEELNAAARLRWAPSDSLLDVFIAEISALHSVEDWQRLNRLAGVLGGRVRLDRTVDPNVYIAAFDSSRTIFAGDREWKRNATDLIARAFFAFGRPEQALAAADELAAMDWPLPPFVPPNLRQSWLKMGLTTTSDAPMALVREDIERVEAAIGDLPPMAGPLRLIWTRAGEFERADAYPMIVPNLSGGPPVDTAGLRMAIQGWEAGLRGDDENALRSIEDGFRRLGTNDMWSASPAVFELAQLLSRLPERRQQGIRMLRWYTRNRAAEAGRAWLALARALDADGDRPGAREAYEHVLRIWRDADEYLQDELREAREALQRLVVESA